MLQAQTAHVTEPAASSLARRFGFAFFAFVVTGSLLLLGWLGLQERAESARVFEALAQADADFIRELRLPRSEKLAGDLGRLLKMEIFFRDQNGHFVPALPAGTSLSARASGGRQPLADGREALALRLDDEHDVIFVRPAAAVTASLARPGTLGVLAVFWLLSLALAWAVAKGVVRPLRDLTARLPRFFSESTPPVPEATRTDEIGLLARALLDARVRVGEERALREQSEKLALLGRMATGLAHEIKNPVASIQLHAQLADSEERDAETRKSLAMIQSESRVIEGLVNQWLYVARPAPPQTALINAREVLLQTIEAISPQAEHADVTLKLRFQTELPVKGDRQRLAQAFRNLAINAIQAMPEGGTLVIAGAVSAGVVTITFTDTGRGFSKDALRNATELFFSEREGGLGIGLNVVKEVITHHGGAVRCANVRPQGAEVTITLPAG